MRTETAYIGKCRTEGCSHARRVPASEFVENTSSAPGAAWWNRRTSTGYVNCPDHGAYKVKRLDGRHSPDVPCTEKCVNATGPSCDCSCGGHNHGINH